MRGSMANVARQELVRTLKERIGRMEGAFRHSDSPDAARVPSGCEALDRLLPDGAFRRGTLVEWLADAMGGGAASLAFGVAREACRDAGAMVVLDRQHAFYPPAAASLGIDLSNVIVVQPSTEKDHLWALDQALRCPAVGAVLSWLPSLDARTFRRLQLAAEEGESLGFLMRPAKARAEPSWAEARLLVEPRPSTAARRLRITLLHARGGPSGAAVQLEIDDETGFVHLASEWAAASCDRTVRWVRPSRGTGTTG
ncbi:MAG: ImuA family protein [Pirellulales bacterium]